MATWQEIQQGIFAGESGGDYNALFGYQNRPGGRFEGVQVSEMSIADILDFTNPRGEYGQYVKRTRPDPEMGVATPVGAYQVVGTTLRDAVKKLGIDPSQKFDKATQDRIGKYIFETQGAKAFAGYKGPKMDGQQPTAPQMQQMQQQPRGLMGILRDPRTRQVLSSFSRTEYGKRLGEIAEQDLERQEKQLLKQQQQREQQKMQNRTAQYLRTQPGGEPYAKAIESGIDARMVYEQYVQQMTKGGISQQEINKMVVDARKEFTGLKPVKVAVKFRPWSFADVGFAYSRVVRSADDPSPAGDLALIFNFMKVLDPGSVVREGEFATAQNAGGVDERVRSLYNQVREGTRLTETQRADFVDRAGRLYGGAQEQYQSIAEQYSEFARRAGLDPSLVIPDFGFKGTIPEKPLI